MQSYSGLARYAFHNGAYGVTQFRTSKKGVDLIKLYEGFRDRPEQLESGSWLVGYGQVRDGEAPSRINRSEASNQLRWNDLPKWEDVIQSTVLVPLNQNEFDALVSFAFNLGEDEFKQSDVLSFLNAGQKLKAAAAFEQWTEAKLHGRTQTVDALVRRRAAEKALFLAPEGQVAAATSALYRPSRPAGLGEQVHDEGLPIPTPPKSRETTREDVKAQLTRILGPNGAKVSRPSVSSPPAPSSATIAEAVSNMARAQAETDLGNRVSGADARIDDFEAPEISESEALAAVRANERLAAQSLAWLSPEAVRRGGIALLGFVMALIGVVWAVQNEFSGAVSQGGVQAYLPSAFFICGGLICLAAVAELLRDTSQSSTLSSAQRS